MIEFFHALPKHVKTAGVSIIRHLAMSLSASSAVTITLILFSAFLMVAGNVSTFANNIEEDLQIHVQLQPNIKDKKTIDMVEHNIGEVSGIKKITYSSPAHELDMMIKEKGEEFAMYKGKNNPLASAFFVTVKNADQIKTITQQIKKINHVRDAVYGGNSVSKLVSVLNTVRIGGLAFVILLTILAVFLIFNAIKTTIYARNSEISIMRNVGASNWYIKVPFMIEGMIIGFIGSIIPCILTFFGYQYLFHAIHGELFTSMFSLQPIFPFALEICGILILSGMAVGLVGSYLSTTKYLRWKR